MDYSGTTRSTTSPCHVNLNYRPYVSTALVSRVRMLEETNSQSANSFTGSSL